MQALALKYRPHTFEDVVEQDNIKIILKQQLESGDVKNSYLFKKSSFIFFSYITNCEYNA